MRRNATNGAVAPAHERLNFANQLRGIAALLVAGSHLIGVFWGMRVFVAASTFSPVQPGALPAFYHLVGYDWYEAGPLGVAFFFLISGLVIPFSLRHHTRASFLIARLLRIYPTFIVATCCELLLLAAAARYWHMHFTHGTRTIAAEFLLVSDAAGTPVIDFVSWTLSIELKFYLLMMIFASLIKRGSLVALFALASGMLLAEIAIGRHALPPFLTSLGMESPYLIFMLIGVLFHFLHVRLCGFRMFVGCVIAMTLLFIVSWRLSAEAAEYPVVTVNYLAAILLFGLLYAVRRHIPESRALDFMAAVSYPFYLVHAVFGFTIMKFLMLTCHVDYAIALAATLPILLSIAYAIHRLVELRSIAWGRRLSLNATNDISV